MPEVKEEFCFGDFQESPTLSHGSRTPPIGSGNVQKVKARLEKTKKIQLSGKFVITQELPLPVQKFFFENELTVK